MNLSDLFARAGLKMRDIQQEYASAVYAGLGATGRVALLSADTGVGKTLGYLAAALCIIKHNPEARFVIATSTHALMNQIMNHDRLVVSRMADIAGIPGVTFSRLLGKANYVSPEKVRKIIRAYPASRVDELNMLEELGRWRRPLVAFEEEYGALPAGVTPEMVTYSLWDKMSAIHDTYQEAIKARFVVTSHAMVIIDSFSNHAVLGDKANRYLIIDEADAFADMTERWQHRRLNLRTLQHSLEQYLTPKKSKMLAAVVDKIRDAAGTHRFLSNRDTTEIYKDAIAELVFIGDSIKDEETKKSFTAALFSWDPALLSGGHTGVGVSRIRKEPSLIRINPFVGRNIGAYTAQWKSTLLTSATLSITSEPSRGMEWITGALGLKEELISLRDIFTPESYGDMALTIAGGGFAEIFSSAKVQHLSETWLAQVVTVIKNASTNGPVVVLTASHDESHEIARRLRDVGMPVYQQKAGQLVSELVKQYAENPGILISAGAWTGLNLRNADGSQMFQDLIITRMKFAPPDRDGAESYQQYLHQLGYETTVQSITRSNYVNQLQKVVRAGKQAVGRGIRSENDRVRLTILDPRFPEPKEQSSKYRALENIIPVRFRRVYRHCTILSPADVEEDLVC
ncbi:DEAD/DEAH box helicase [Salmonella enterica]|uniref:DNA 5'-3' helicase n=1 Tax=Salmonella enterica subsp. enterica serovar Lattenkamp TaxID=2564671 RepID=A0A5W2M2U9_SALET|nr:helicase [Salmonella enterica subsp. enterica serovar Lattenkamp]EAQ8610872.1 DEAD/DEAH box helicase [Salmonella enterica]ECJ3925564.1 helicase [Salmonella enterica subsp. enterica]EAR5597595.1 DEAD/DEAH box helicase [Salmonella enterica]EAV2737492.1 DEAD/DEAH box helicase [Salmonella enterica]